MDVSPALGGRQMAEGLHEISQAIGRLQANDDSSQRQRADLYNKVDALKADMNKGFQEIRDLLAPMANLPKHIDRHCEDFEAVAKRLGAVEGFIQQVRGASKATKAAWSVGVVLVPAMLFAGGYFVTVKPVTAGLESRLKNTEQRTDALWGLLGPPR